LRQILKSICHVPPDFKTTCPLLKSAYSKSDRLSSLFGVMLGVEMGADRDWTRADGTIETPKFRPIHGTENGATIGVIKTSATSPYTCPKL